MASEQVIGDSDDPTSRATQPEQLAAEIEKTREDLASTLDAIADKVSPKRVAKRGTKKVADTVKETAASAKEAVTHKAAQAADAAKGKASDVQGALHSDEVPPDPTGEPAGPIVAAGDVSAPGRHEADADSTTVIDLRDNAAHKAQAVAQEVKHAAGHAKEAAAARLSQVRDSVTGATPSGHSLSEPDQREGALLRKEIALGAVLAVIGLLLLRHRRSR